MSEATAAAKRRLEEVVSFFEINADAQVAETDEGIELEIEASPATPRLIGHHGETLRAIEYLVNQMVKQVDGSAPRVLVDVAGYRRGRREALELMAAEVGRRVVETGQAEELKPMSPAERRIVHMALRELPVSEPESAGELRGRRILVRPLSSGDAQ